MVKRPDLTMQRRKMKILFLTSSMETGGAERVAALLASAWADQGHDVTLMPTFSGRGDCAFPLSDSVELRFLADIASPNAGKLARLRTLRAFIRSAQPDVIISFLPHVNAAAVAAAAGLGIPVVACERTYPPLLQPPLPPFYRIARRLTYPFAAALVGQTETAAVWLRARAGRAPVATIPNPVVNPLPSNPPRLNPGDLFGPDRKLVLWAGRFEESKRADVLIDAFARIAAGAAGWDVILLGDGPARAAAVEQVRQHGLEDRIRLPGFAGNLAEWYARADAFVMTSSYEGFPNALLEALAQGLPSIAFDVLTGPAELADNGRRLILLPDRDHVDALADALSTLLADEARRAELGRAALETATDYSKDRVLAMWDDLFAKVVRSGGATEAKL